MKNYTAEDNVFIWQRLNGIQDVDDILDQVFSDIDAFKAEVGRKNRLQKGDIVCFPESVCIMRKVYKGVVYICPKAGVDYVVEYVDYDTYSLRSQDEQIWMPKYPVEDETGNPIDWRSLVVGGG